MHSVLACIIHTIIPEHESVFYDLDQSTLRKTMITALMAITYGYTITFAE